MTSNGHLNQIVEKKIQWARDNPSLCLFPWSMFDIRRSIVPGGKVNVTCCCNLDEFKLSNQNNPDDPLEHTKNSINSGTLPVECHRCTAEEQHGGTSERIRRILAEKDQDLERFKETRYVNSYGVRVKFSNLCLQACRSCHPHDSSVWHKLSRDPNPNLFEKDVADDPEFWTLITESISREIDLHSDFHIDLMGGETLIQTGADKLINWVCEQGYQDRIEVRITTSLSALPERVLLNLTKFKRVLFMLSVDSVGDNYRYVRWPVEFSKIEENLNYLIDFGDRHQAHFNFMITPVFSLNNIFYIRDFIEYWHQWFIQRGRSFFMMNTNITMPTAYLDIQALPKKYRNILKATLTDCLNHAIFTDYPKDTGHIYNFLNSTIRELSVWEDNPQLWNLFLKFTAEFDRRTNTSFSQLNSRLYNILDTTDQQVFNTMFDAVDTNKVLRSKAYLLKLHGLPY
jgi:hypothetical protein